MYGQKFYQLRAANNLEKQILQKYIETTIYENSRLSFIEFVHEI